MIRTTTALALALSIPLLAGSPAQAEVAEQSETHFVVRQTLDLVAEPKDVWLALIAPGDWWNDSHSWSGDASNMTLTPQAGGCFCEKIPAEDEKGSYGLEGSVQHMVVIQAVPRKVLRMRGALGPLQSEPVDGVLTITLQPIAEADPDSGAKKGTRIVWEYVVGGTMRFDIDTISKAVDKVIGEQANGLAEATGGLLLKKPAEDKSSPFDEAFGPNADKKASSPKKNDAKGEDDSEDEKTPTKGLGRGR